MEYCGYLFNGVTDSQHKRLQLTQNRCLRTCLNVRIRYHIADLHRDAGVDYLSVRYDIQLLLLLHKYLYSEKHDNKALGLEFRRVVPGERVMRSTGTGLLEYPKSTLKGFNKSPLYRGISLWNKLHSSCRTEQSKDTFRAKAIVHVRTLFLAKQRERGQI